LKYLKRNDIDPVLWNTCIESNEYYIPYARFEYLDALCNGSWGALVKGRYEAVFPLPYKKKWGLIPFVYQPVFCQQLGIFGNPSGLTTNDFIRKIPSFFVRIHLQIHGGFGIPSNSATLPNFIKKPPHHPDQDFNKDALKNLRKLDRLDVGYTQTKDIRMVLKLYHNAWGELANLSWPEDYSSFESACTSMQHQSKIYACVARSKGAILGAAIFLKGHKTLYYVCAAPTLEGKKHGRMHGIIAHAIENFPDHTIDFEGSQIESVAAFYQKFGSENLPYYRIERTLWL